MNIDREQLMAYGSRNDHLCYGGFVTDDGLLFHGRVEHMSKDAVSIDRSDKRVDVFINSTDIDELIKKLGKKRVVVAQKNDTDGGIVCSFCGNPWEVLSIAEEFGCYSMCAWCGTKIGGIDETNRN